MLLLPLVLLVIRPLFAAFCLFVLSVRALFVCGRTCKQAGFCQQMEGEGLVRKTMSSISGQETHCCINKKHKKDNNTKYLRLLRPPFVNSPEILCSTMCEIGKPPRSKHLQLPRPPIVNLPPATCIVQQPHQRFFFSFSPCNH